MGTLSDRLEMAFNAELARRLMVRYFYEKGFSENFDRKIYPLELQDMTAMIPEMASKVEVVPHALDIDPTSGFAKLGWNLFVLGHHRMYLGETEHSNVNELAEQLTNGAVINDGFEPISRNERTPRDVIRFITRCLREHEGGLIRGLAMGQQSPVAAAGQGQHMFERPKTIRPEGGSQHG